MDDSDDKASGLERNKGVQHCPNVNRCPMFPIFTQTFILNIYKNAYCHSNFERCARLKAMQSGTPPPKNLLPDGSTLDHDL